MISIQRQNTKVWHRTNAVLRLAILRGATRPFATNTVVNEYPKSGGTWMSQMLAEALELPFPRNRLPMLKSCLMQCHVLNPIGMRNVTVVWRDGRDIVVSFYHHLLTGHEFSSAEMIREHARALGICDPRDIERNLPTFIEALFQCRIGPSFTWTKFVDNWYGRPGVVSTRYEDLLKNASLELQRVVSELGHEAITEGRAKEIVSKFSFENQTGRTRGDEKPGQFARKGIAGDWATVFSKEASETFEHYAGEALDRLGYPRVAK